MSIVRVGLSETKDFHDGYDRIFGKKKDEQPATEAKAEEKKEENKEQEQAK